jgi:hypothetical protein
MTNNVQLCKKPISILSLEFIEDYNQNVNFASKSAAFASKEYESAALHYVKAIQICDEDISLHGKLAWLREELK